MTSTRSWIATPLVMVSLVGCISAGSVGVGYQAPVDGAEGYDSFVVEGRVAGGGIVKLGAAARSKLGEARDQIALSPELSIEMSPGPVTVGARVGVSLLQLDNEDGEWSAGLGSPYLQPLLQLRLGEPVYFFVGGTIEYELSTTERPDMWYVGAQAGLGISL